MIYAAPLYLTGLVTEVNEEILSEIQKSYGKNTTAFKFNTNFRRLVRTWIEEYGQYGGTIWGIEETKNETIVFDPSKHGYNGVMEIDREEDLTSTRTIELIGGTEIVIAFQYSGDEEEYSADGTSKFEQDYFSWIVVYKYFDSKLEEVLNYECA